MTKTHVYFPDAELRALHVAAKRSGKSVAEVVREAVRTVCVRPGSNGPVALWTAAVKRTSVDHDSIYDEP